MGQQLGLCKFRQPPHAANGPQQCLESLKPCGLQPLYWHTLLPPTCSLWWGLQGGPQEAGLWLSPLHLCQGNHHPTHPWPDTEFQIPFMPLWIFYLAQRGWSGHEDLTVNIGVQTSIMTGVVFVLYLLLPLNQAAGCVFLLNTIIFTVLKLAKWLPVLREISASLGCADIA